MGAPEKPLYGWSTMTAAGGDTQAHRRRMDVHKSPGLTRSGYRLVLLITGLSVAHHVDHILRDVTGWPLAGGFNLFTASLLVYPVIAAGAYLSRRERVGPLFWSFLAGGGAIFILLVHIGPAAGDAVEEIPGQYGRPWLM